MGNVFDRGTVVQLVRVESLAQNKQHVDQGSPLHFEAHVSCFVGTLRMLCGINFRFPSAQTLEKLATAAMHDHGFVWIGCVGRYRR